MKWTSRLDSNLSLRKIIFLLFVLPSLSAYGQTGGGIPASPTQNSPTTTPRQPLPLPPPEIYAPVPPPTSEMANSPQPTVLDSSGNQISTPLAKPNSYRLMVNYNYSLVSPVALNDNRRVFLWNSTTAALGAFDAMNGFSIGAGVHVDIGALGDGYFGVEYASAFQELANTTITGGSTTVQDSFNYETVYAMFDWRFQHKQNTFEIGIGAGQAIKYQYHNLLASGSTKEDIIWEDTPLVFKIRANYNYHFTDYIYIRAGAEYERMTSSALKTETAHPTVSFNGSPIALGQILKNTSGQDQIVDMSGARFNAGLVVSF